MVKAKKQPMTPGEYREWYRMWARQRFEEDAAARAKARSAKRQRKRRWMEKLKADPVRWQDEQRKQAVRSLRSYYKRKAKNA